MGAADITAAAVSQVHTSPHFNTPSKYAEGEKAERRRTEASFGQQMWPRPF